MNAVEIGNIECVSEGLHRNRVDPGRGLLDHEAGRDIRTIAFSENEAVRASRRVSSPRTL